MIYSNPLEKRVKDFAKRVAIKDGDYTFQIFDDAVRITLCVRREDNFKPGVPVNVMLTETIPIYSIHDDPTQMLGLICWKLAGDFAMHEIAEQFYIDGRLPYDPHRVGK
jgi:hypothetical protein